MQVLNIAAAVILNPNGQMLLVRKTGTTAFMQPGGKIQPEETAESALLRELAEELDGWTPSVKDIVCHGQYTAPAAHEENTIVIADLFSVTTNVELRVSAEIEEAIWVTLGEAIQHPLAPLTKDVCIPIGVKCLASSASE